MKPLASANLGPDWTAQQEHEMTTSADLLKINVNEHTEKKNGLTYLSWAWAWAEVLKIDPKAGWSISSFKTGEVGPLYFPDGSAMVGVNVTIRNDTKGSVLPVMNHRNQAIKNPDAFAINTAIMRCLAKAIAMHGLGLYIYAGEDLPEGDDKPESVEPQYDVPPARMKELETLAADMLALQEEGRELAAASAFYALPDQADKMAVWGMLKGQGGGSTPESRLRSFIKANKPESTQ